MTSNIADLIAEATAKLATDITTATPAQIDVVNAALYRVEALAERSLAVAIDRVHRSTGERQVWMGRRQVWRTSTADAVAAARAIVADPAYTEIPRTGGAGESLARFDAATADLAAVTAAQAPMDAEWNRRGGWSRFFLVDGGHYHSSMHCSTCNRGAVRTSFGWNPEMSGMSESDALTELGRRAAILCTVCFPNAPVLPVAPRKTREQIAADKAAAADAARVADPKLIADVDGSTLRVDGAVLRTVRSAEIAAVDELWYAASGRHQGERNESYAADCERNAGKIVAALAHKAGVDPAVVLARLTAKALVKIKRDLGAEVAAAAAAHWAAK